MKISIITVCFNSEATIENTIRSVASQTYKEIEYIIVDGNSTDKTVEIIKKYENTVVTKWISEKDSGLYDAMNKGIKMATGDYIGILNSDDVFYETTTIEQVASFIEKNKGIDAITGNIVQHNGKKIVRKYSSKSWVPNRLKIGFMPPHPSIFIKRSLFDKFGFYTLGYRIAADYELIIRFFLKNKISYLYSGITTTTMLVGGASSSGLQSYKIITEEVRRGFNENNLNYYPILVKYRIIWKILSFLKS